MNSWQWNSWIEGRQVDSHELYENKTLLGKIKWNDRQKNRCMIMNSFLCDRGDREETDRFSWTHDNKTLSGKIKWNDTQKDSWHKGLMTHDHELMRIEPSHVNYVEWYTKDDHELMTTKLSQGKSSGIIHKGMVACWKWREMLCSAGFNIITNLCEIRYLDKLYADIYTYTYVSYIQEMHWI